MALGLLNSTDIALECVMDAEGRADLGKGAITFTSTGCVAYLPEQFGYSSGRMLSERVQTFAHRRAHSFDS